MFNVSNQKGLIALTNDELQEKLRQAYQKGYEDALRENKAKSGAKRTLTQNGKPLKVRNGIVEEKENAE